MRIEKRSPVGIKEISGKLVSVKVFKVSERDGSWRKLWFDAVSNTID